MFSSKLFSGLPIKPAWTGYLIPHILTDFSLPEDWSPERLAYREHSCVMAPSRILACPFPEWSVPFHPSPYSRLCCSFQIFTPDTTLLLRKSWVCRAWVKATSSVKTPNLSHLDLNCFLTSFKALRLKFSWWDLLCFATLYLEICLCFSSLWPSIILVIITEQVRALITPTFFFFSKSLWELL